MATQVSGYAWLPEHVEFAAQLWNGDNWRDGYHSPYATIEEAADAAMYLEKEVGYSETRVRIVERTVKTRVITVE